MQTHLALTPVAAWGPKCYAVWALQPVGRAVLFVHGFGGDPLTTWNDFQSLVQTDPKLAGVDCIFYGYDGVFSDAVVSGTQFLRFLDQQLFTAPATAINSSLPCAASRAAGFSYQDLIIVAHSLGAVVSRLALVLGHAAAASWLTRVRLLFFAPAHSGADSANVITSAVSNLGFLGGLVSGAVRFSSPLIDQLKPGSSLLGWLREESQRVALSGGSSCLRPVKVIIAEKERIVSNVPFPGDPVPIVFEGKDHTSLCKPSSQFTKPFDVLRELI